MSLKMEIRSIGLHSFFLKLSTKHFERTPTFILEITHSSLNYIYLNVRKIVCNLLQVLYYVFKQKALEFLIFVCRYSGLLIAKILYSKQVLREFCLLLFNNVDYLFLQATIICIHILDCIVKKFLILILTFIIVSLYFGVAVVKSPNIVIPPY